MKDIKERVLPSNFKKRLDMAMNGKQVITDPYIVPYIELYEHLEKECSTTNRTLQIINPIKLFRYPFSASTITAVIALGTSLPVWIVGA